MHYRNRVLLFVTAVVLVSVLSVSLVVGWQARSSVLDEARKDGELIAQLLSRSAAAADEIPQKVEAILGDQMLAQAQIVAQWMATAETAQLGKDVINAELKTLTERSVIDEIWVTDSFGEAVYNSVGIEGFVFDPNPEKQPQAHAFWPLLTNDVAQVVQRAQPRELDQKLFKYVGVTGVDQPRIVEVGLNADFLHALKKQVGLEYMVQKLVGQGKLNAIWVLSPNMKTLASGSIKGAKEEMALDSETLDWLETIYQSKTTRTRMQDHVLVVGAPLVNPVSGLQGVTLLHLPVERLEQAQVALIHSVIRVTLVVLVAALLLAAFMSRRVTRPLAVINEALSWVAKGRYDLVDMKGLAERNDEFGRLSQVFEEMAATVGEREADLDRKVQERTRLLQQKNQALVSLNDRMTQELDVARTFQKAILPTSFPDIEGRLAFSAAMEPAREMGGDFYDVFLIDDNRVVLVMADVSDKGVPSAFFMAICRTEIQNAAFELGAEATPGDILHRVNQRLLQENPLELFVTVFLGVLAVDSGHLAYASAGHNPPLLLQADDTGRWLDQARGTVLGMLEGLEWECHSLNLSQGDRLVLYTDGITEAFDASQEPFGEGRLMDLSQSLRQVAPDKMALTVLQSVSGFIKGAPVSDDRTLLCLAYIGNRSDGHG
ncbi:PP2C family protein-serine/threonine phosphatase [Hydrogenovibrio halophilus]|uniref:PP2C family protein-serine/threonine phosphatase n=1 Tax=Hydrogenovibrio halophilus TaxID=373391 RepID=UPI000360E679|nr:PP2C family protein-serine/threonine phosphatase [Hydrogenovibrio halophilus]